MTSSKVWPIRRADVLNNIDASRREQRKQHIERRLDMRADMASIVKYHVDAPHIGRNFLKHGRIVLASAIDLNALLLVPALVKKSNP